MAKYCSKCGVMLTEGAAFCSSCGARVELSEPPVQPTNQYQFQQTVLPQKKKGGLLKGIVFLALALVLIVESISDSMQMVKQDGKWYISVMGNNFY
ncbi:MAG: zinc ribbon domain-containing protein [Mobilitalea sp.]